MSRILMILPFLCWLDLSSARPAEEPTRFTLGTNESEAVPPSRLEQGKELLGRIADAIRIGRGRFVNSIILAKNIIADQTEQLTGEAQNLVSTIAQLDEPIDRRSSISQGTTPIITLRPMERQTASLENETGQAFFEKRKPDNVRRILDSFLMPTPLVDRIKETEKYGNSGDKFSGIGRAIIDAYENFSNFLNTVVEIPYNAVKQTSRGITRTLDNLGSKLVGLQ